MGLYWIRLECVSSTNGYLASLVRRGKIRKETAVIADYQESGRGQGDHAWESERGSNLLMSLLLFPEFLSASSQFMISKLVSTSLCEILEANGLVPSIKWPNDIITDHGKIAGILIEHAIEKNHLSHTIIGVGLNLNQIRFREYAPRATSTMMEKQIRLDPGETGESLARRILAKMEHLKNGNWDPLDEEYLKRLHMKDRTTTFMAGGLTFRGIIRGVNEVGELLVEQHGLVASYGHQEIKW